MPAGDLSGKLNRLYPVFDEAAAGSLQAVLNADAQLVARNLPDDPAGGEDVSFAGATIDRASIHATKDSSGNLQSIDVTIHATEPLESATLATGLRLASVTTNGATVKTFAGAAQAVSGDAYSAKFTLSPADWTTLNDPAAQALSIGVTPTLRAHGWASGLPILPPTEWAQLNGVFTTPALPVEIRDSLSSIATFVAAISNSSQNTTTIYDVPSVALVGSTGDGADAASALFTAKFQALPFSDPATGLVYARARWYNPETGTFLSGDPMGYSDSSNPYSFAGGDQVNRRDPDGLRVKIAGRDPKKSFEVFKGSLHNPKAAGMLEMDTQHGNFVRLKQGFSIADFKKSAIPQWPYFDVNQTDLGIPLSADKRSIEEKYADLITSTKIVEFRAESGAKLKQKTRAEMRLFADSLDVTAASQGGGVTVFSDESLSGNVEVAVDTEFIKKSGATIASYYRIDAYDAEITAAHELGHALADVDEIPPCRQSWSVRLDNQVRDRMGHHGNLRVSEKPVNKDPKSLACDESKLKK